MEVKKNKRNRSSFKVNVLKRNRMKTYMKKGNSINKHLNLNIAELGLSLQLYHNLIQNRILTVDDLLHSLKKKSFIESINYNPKDYLEILNKLHEKGILKEAYC